jgi:hypothetical protein
LTAAEVAAAGRREHRATPRSRGSSPSIARMMSSIAAVLVPSGAVTAISNSASSTPEG